MVWTTRTPGAAAVALMCASSMVSCATPGETVVERADRPELSRLARLAGSERGRSRLTDVPLPPGVQEPVLLHRDSGDRAARMPLDAALERLAVRQAPAVSNPPPPPLDPETRDAALRHYVRGLDAAIGHRDMAAIFELDAAARLDPANPVILRRLARQHFSRPQAAGVYKRLLEVEPDDSESLFALGLAETNRRSFGQAVAYLARPRLAGGTFDHDPAAPALADYMLALALEQLGYDRAALVLYRSLVSAIPDPVATATLYPGRLRSLYTRRGEVWQSIGDAHCRLGEYNQALDAYRHSAPLSADPAALNPRVVYAHLRLGRPYSAQFELANALDDDSPVSERHIQLLAYLAETVGDVSPLAAAVGERVGPGAVEPSVVRAVAVLLDRGDAQVWLQDYLNERPDDLEAVSQLLEWLLDRDAGSAVSLTVALAEAHPDLAERYGDRLAGTGASVRVLLEAAVALPPTPARAVVECRLMLSIGALGPAWRVVESARATWPRDRLMARARIEIVAALREPGLLSADTAVGSGHADPQLWLALARAYFEVGTMEPAIRAATRAVEFAAADTLTHVEALVALARAQALHALGSVDDASRRQHAGAAARSAQLALELRPGFGEACQVLLRLYRPGGMLADPEQWAGVRAELQRAAPRSELLARMNAANDIERGRFERALERLLDLVDRDPPDSESIGLVIAAWSRLGRADEADRWLTRRLEQRPGDPDLLSEWVALQIRHDRLAIGAEHLESLLRLEPMHDHARRLLEAIYRRQGRADDAVAMARHRLESQPRGARRELELAAVHAASGQTDETLTRLEWVHGRVSVLTERLLLSAMRIAQSIEGERAETMALAFARSAADRFPGVPLQVYGVVMLGIARQGDIGEQFDEYAHRALAQARGAAGPSVEVADQWRALAQVLTDAGVPEAAGRALRARIWAEPILEPQALSRLTSAALVADAAADRPGSSIQLLKTLSLQGPLPRLAGIDADLPLAEALYEISIIYALVGHQQGAVTLLREAIAREPEHAMALNNLGFTRVEMGHADTQTQQWIEHAFRLAPDDANILDTVGWLRYKRGMFEGRNGNRGALGLIEQALKRSREPSPEVLDHLGDTRWRLGDHDGAARVWRQAVEILENAERRDRHVQQYGLIQRFWGLSVIDPAEIYRMQNDLVLQRLRSKLRSVGSGEQPAVAETFDELETTGPSGEAADGGS